MFTRSSCQLLERADSSRWFPAPERAKESGAYRRSKFPRNTGPCALPLHRPGEFEPFEALYRQLEKLGGGPLPTFVSTPYLALKAKLAERASKEK
jgi:hypothetical protein